MHQTYVQVVCGTILILYLSNVINSYCDDLIQTKLLIMHLII